LRRPLRRARLREATMNARSPFDGPTTPRADLLACVGRSDVDLVAVGESYDGAVAVDQISLRIPRASYCCLLGPSGCGKNTTLRMIAGHEAITDGDILIGGQNVSDLPPVARGTAMMFQSYALFPHLNCLDNVAFSLKMR